MALALDSLADDAAVESSLEPVKDPATGKPAIVAFKRADSPVRLAVARPAAGGPMRLAIERATKRDGKTITRWRATSVLADFRDAVKHNLVTV